jgi:hypothetical protein
MLQPQSLDVIFEEEKNNKYNNVAFQICLLAKGKREGEGGTVQAINYLLKPTQNKASAHVTLVKKKAVPLHTMEALGGRGGIAPTHSRPRH